MNAAQVELERRYRRWLSWYPGWFRRDHADEILAVLLDSAQPGQRRPAKADCLDLLRGGLGMRLRPRIPRSDGLARAVCWAMYAGAAVELAVLVTLLATLDEVRATILAHDPDYTGAQWHAAVSEEFKPLMIAASASVLLWLWLAWACGRGHRWATVPFVVFFVENTRSLLNGLAHGSATYASKDLATGTVLWLLEAVIVGLLAWVWTQRIRARRRSWRDEASAADRAL